MTQPTALRPLEELIEQLCDCEGSRLNGRARELANGIRELLPEMERLLGERVAAMRGAAAALARTRIPDEDGTELSQDILALSDEQADKWLAEHDKEIVAAAEEVQIIETSQFLEKVSDSMADKFAEYEKSHVTGALARHDRELTKRVLADKKAAIESLAYALDSVWAAIGDALCSGQGIEKTYAHGVLRDVTIAREKARALGGSE